MARVCRHYVHQDFSGLLAELQSAGTEAEKPQPVPEKPKPVEKIIYISPDTRKRASLMGNPKMRYAYSLQDDTIHDRDCDAVKKIKDADFRMLSEFDLKRPTCKQCYRKALIRSSIGDDAKYINAYVRFFDRLNASTTDLNNLILNHKARLSDIDIDRVVLRVHDDRWMIRFQKDKPLLFHNNYTVSDDYQRFFSDGYHLQNDGGNHNFHLFVRMMVTYSWAEHVEILKARALAALQAKLRERLSALSNWLHVPQFSLLNSYYTVVDCNHRLSRFLRKNGMQFIPTEKVHLPYSSYRLVTCRIRKWQKSRFLTAMDELKEYTVVEGYHDYADICDQELFLSQNDNYKCDHLQKATA